MCYWRSQEYKIFYSFRWTRRIAKSKYLLRHICISVCPTVRKELGSHWTYFRENCNLNVFRISIGKIPVYLTHQKNNGYFTWIPTCIYDISLDSSHNEKKVPEKHRSEEQNTHFKLINFSTKIVSFMCSCGKTWCSRADHSECKTVHALCMLDN
jgi:hypothetical protein